MTKAKAFLQSLNLFSLDPLKAKTFLEDKRLTQAEKRILKCFFMLRENKLKAIFEEMDKVVGDLDPFVEAQKNLIIGLAYNNSDHFAQALPYLEKSLEFLPAKGMEYFRFIGLYNLFAANMNLKDEKTSKEILQQLKQIKSSDERVVLNRLRCFFMFYAFIGDYSQAEDTLEEIKPYKKTMSESVIISHLLNEFDFYIKIENIKKAQTVLREMKKHRKFNQSETYNFMKMLLEHYTDNVPLYILDQDFTETPLLFHQIKTIAALEEDNKVDANTHWKALQDRYPITYLDNFHYHGDRCLFSICLKKYLSLKTVPLVNQEDLSSKKVDALLVLLQNAVKPISKETLFQLAWGRPVQDKEDLVKLSRSIYRLKQKHGLDIKTRKGCYFVETSLKKVS